MRPGRLALLRADDEVQPGEPARPIAARPMFRLMVPADSDPSVPGGAPTDLRGVLCVTCEYDLSGLNPGGVCPECGTPVERSVRGGLLVDSRPEHAETLRRGALVIVAAVATQVAIFIGSLALAVAATPPAGQGSSGPFVALTITSTAITLAALLGWWWLSEPSPEPDLADPGSTRRAWLRTAIVLQGATVTLSAATGIAGPLASPRGAAALATIGSVATTFYLIAAIVQFFASMAYLRWLGPRLPDRKVFKRSRTLMWLVPVLVTVGSLCFFIGPIIAVSLYLSLMHTVWRDLDAVVRRQRGAA